VILFQTLTAGSDYAGPFEISVALQDDTLIVGATYGDGAYVFKLHKDDDNYNTCFGQVIAISRSTVVNGAPNRDGR
jgi:hypothetical protein